MPSHGTFVNDCQSCFRIRILPAILDLGGIHLGGNAVIHQFTLNFTRSDGETDNKQLIQNTQETYRQRIVD